MGTPRTAEGGNDDKAKLITLLLSLAVFWQSPANAATYLLKFYQVDDDMSAYITNSDFSDQLVLHRSFGADYPYVDITPFVTNGLNTLKLTLTNGPKGYSYGYDFQINGLSYASGACGIFNIYGCDADSYETGLVWTSSIRFDGDVDRIPSPVPEPTIWASLILGFGVVGSALRRKNRYNRGSKIWLQR